MCSTLMRNTFQKPHPCDSALPAGAVNSIKSFKIVVFSQQMFKTKDPHPFFIIQKKKKIHVKLQSALPVGYDKKHFFCWCQRDPVHTRGAARHDAQLLLWTRSGLCRSVYTQTGASSCGPFKFREAKFICLFFFSSASSSQSFKLTEQPIKDAVITVPTFFNQAERRAVLQAAQMAGLKVLQLINDNTAVALNYGVFRRKDIDATPKVHRNGNMSNEKNSSRYFDVG